MGPHEGEERGRLRPDWVRTMDIMAGADQREEAKNRVTHEGIWKQNGKQNKM